MTVVAIVGAGPLGGALARALAARDQFSRILLIDDEAGIAAGKALDIQQAGAVEGFRTHLVGSADPSAVAQGSIVVLADGAGPSGTEWHGEAALALLRRIVANAPGAVIVCAGASQRDLIERGVRELGLPRGRLLGSAPVALASAVRSLVALEADASAADVSLSVLGVPPRGAVVPWSDAIVAGVAADRSLTPQQVARLNGRLPHLWPPGPYALATAAARVCEAIPAGSRRLFCCFVCLQGELFARHRAAALPLRLGPGGVDRIVIPPLTTHERVRLENAVRD